MKKNKFLNFIYYVLLITVIIFPVFTFAYTLLQPLPGLEREISDQGGLKTYLSWVYKFAFVAAAFLAVIQIIIGGVQLIIGGASETAQSDGRKRIEQALWGLLLAILAYLILYTINSNLLKIGFSIPDITAVKEELTTSIVPITPPAFGSLSDAQAKAQLNHGLVGYKSGVSFEGIRQNTINEALALSFDLQKAGVGIGNEFITSGTEGNHSSGEFSHTNGYKLDFRLNSELTNFIEKNYESIGTRNDGAPMYKNSRGAVYAKENDHWDLLVK